MLSVHILNLCMTSGKIIFDIKRNIAERLKKKDFKICKICKDLHHVDKDPTTNKVVRYLTSPYK